MSDKSDQEKAEWLAERAGLRKGAPGWDAWVRACVQIIGDASSEGFSEGFGEGAVYERESR